MYKAFTYYIFIGFLVNNILRFFCNMRDYSEAVNAVDFNIPRMGRCRMGIGTIAVKIQQENFICNECSSKILCTLAT